jgi:NhaA family Na+:H+ antiporter
MRPLIAIREFLALESAGGILLAAAALAAMLFANSPLERLYAAFLETPVEVRAGGFEIAKPLLLWINEGLMAVFFFLVGLELKREAQEGELSQPAIAAIGARRLRDPARCPRARARMRQKRPGSPPFPPR